MSEEKKLLINMMSSPGSGKTTTLKRTIKCLQPKIMIGVLECDIDASVDAAAILETGAKSVQLHTGGMCHMDAQMTKQGLDAIGMGDIDVYTNGSVQMEAQMSYTKYLPPDIANKFELHNYSHAIEILTEAFPEEWKDLVCALSAFSLSEADLSEAGGAETRIPGKIDCVLYPRRWRNVKVSADLHVKFFERIINQKRYGDYPSRESMICDYVGGQYVDYLKGRVAICLEWNKKDIAFDRTITALRELYECNLISVGVIVTRGSDLADAFKTIYDKDGNPISRKYGSSSTWIGKLLPRLDSRQAGGCPILALGIRKECIEG